MLEIALHQLRAAASGLATLLAALALSALALLLGGPTSARAAGTIVVNDLGDAAHGCATTGTGQCSLRDALTYANTLSGPARITFAGSGTILLTGPLPAISGTLALDGARVITLSGVGQYQVLKVNDGAQVSLRRLSVMDALSSGSGGALYSDGALTVSESTFINNSAFDAGGGIFIHSGTLIVNDSTFIGNTGYSGGAIMARAGATIVNSSTFSDNTGFQGGGLYLEAGSLTVSASAFINNPSVHSGGGLYIVTGTTVVSNSTFVNNTTAGQGGGLLNQGILTMTNSTLVSNTAPLGAGGALSNTGTLRLFNTLLANAGTGGNCAGTLAAGLSNLADDASCAGATVTTTAALQLQPLGLYGGHTWTVALGSHSAAIDAGDDAACPPADQRGVSRPQGAHCDVGAFELAEPNLYLPLIGQSY
jgi:CSLREA domain-containing protein